MTQVNRQQLDTQIAYYRARAAEYDEWFYRQGRYDRGPAQREQWFREVGIVQNALAGLAPLGDVLELACGTGLWTERLAAAADHVHAIDASPEVFAIDSLPAADFVFFGFWLSHVPPDRFDSFWRTVRSALRPRGRVFFVDSRLAPSSTAVDHEPPTDAGIERRKLNDGREFEIVKVFYQPEPLQQRLASLGWRANVRTSGDYFVYGIAEADT